MPPEVATLIGGAGTAKTSRLLDLMAKCGERGISAEQIGFVSFTRAARAEAAQRASDRFNVPTKQLERDGWYRTLHSCCYRILGAKKDQMLTGTKADQEWLQGVLQESVSGSSGTEDGDGLAVINSEVKTKADVVLQMWGAARNRLEPLSVVWHEAHAIDEHLPDLVFCERIITLYELGKAAAGRLDFTDLLLRFAGVEMRTEGPSEGYAFGDPPNLAVWCLDECQDTSKLLDMVSRRLVQSARWVYTVGDQFQSIYRWAGSDAKHWLSWPAARREVLSKSYRCPKEIVELGEKILRGCSDYWDRGIEAADHAGRLDRGPLDTLIKEVDPKQSWMILARTNREADALAVRLNRLGMPWRPTRGLGGWAAPVKACALAALRGLQEGGPIDGGAWKQVLKYLPAKHWLEHGTKKRFEDLPHPDEDFPWIMLGDLHELGATEALKEQIASGEWTKLIEDGQRWQAAANKYGVEAVNDPTIRVGTIHSVKGAEASNVLLLTTVTPQVTRGDQPQTAGGDEERRVEYVAVTRARERLLIASDKRANYQMNLPS
jgi:superfamily I DNA/RNA helicase